jgi:hypothetical protein
MKIALITIHHANSYGGMLQALASQTILSKYGEVSIIDYKSKHLAKTMMLIRFGTASRDILRIGKDLFRLIPRYKILNKFTAFRQKYFHLTQECNNHNDLEFLTQTYDVFVCGSDQIWNPNVIGELDGTYFLNFVHDKKKIAYASSAGSYEFSNAEQNEIKKYLSTFSGLALREKNTSEYISKLLDNRPVTTVIDPTLMLNKTQWHELVQWEETDIPEPYIFVYTLQKDVFVKNMINQIAKHLNLKVVAIDQSPFPGYHCDTHYKDADPTLYLKLISQASFVITNSFHGTAFSVNFGIPFISLKPESGTNRIQSFLSSVGLGNRLLLNNENLNTLIHEKINFEEVEIQLNSLRDSANTFLEKSLANGQ